MLSPDDVARIARLARLSLAGPEAERMRGELNGILGLVDQMSAVDTAGVEPMSHPQSVTQRLREDEVTETDQHALFQEGAPAVEDGLFLVPKVIE